MLRRLIVGMAAIALILGALVLTRTSTRERILSNAGPVDADAPSAFTTTQSGLKYRILRRGSEIKPQRTDSVTVHFGGWLDDGTQFETTYGSQPLTSALARVVPGWAEALPLIGEGGMIELDVPGALGYGDRGYGKVVPPGATLHFIVELLDVERVNEPPGAGPRDPDAPEEFTTAESGLKYRILRRGKGRRPTKIDHVTVHYKGWLDDGAVFDSSYAKGMPAKVQLGHDVIAGWTEGIPYVGEGGMIELEVPAELGYGEKGALLIPPGSTLHFVIELLDVN